ncbi:MULTISPECIES: hypothetical protein [Methylomonas]|uniref:hypothetical protein n=1 Tax=Methylomonas TaxID=416 RepID=UPI0007C8E4D5|nr:MULTISPECIES: hypothetical protein [Methylomonas]ANE55036.1 hypothetical protein AYM39_07480 [Methylomonas sp. DH-1]WNB74469.1 hypothetical protein RI210_14390 [Methylomonas koyamae]
MLKIYRKVVVINPNSEQPQLPPATKPLSQRLTELLAIPAMVAGAIVGTLVFSALFAILLIPLSILGFKVWRAWRTAQRQQAEQTLDAEYTVVSTERDENRPGR